jgi:23S rRNA pseudouridine2604 synthase
METSPKRINKFIGETGHCSRREADEMIAAGRITVNGKPAEMGMKVTIEDEIRIDGKLLGPPKVNTTYLAFNKPVGIECTTNTDVKDNIIDYIHYPQRIFPIGRLDKASEGLLLLTNDGDIVNKILRARNNHEKEYIVAVDKPISPRFIERMAGGIPILDTVTRKCEVEQIDKNTFRIILTQGLNRQIRRMCEYLGYEVTALKRIRIINIKLDLPVGRYRELRADEIDQLNKLINDSSKTEEASLPKMRKDGKAETFRKVDPEPERPASRADKPDARRGRMEPGKPAFSAEKPAGKTGFSKKNEPFSTRDDAQRPPKGNGSPNPRQPQPERKIEFIKKDDPRYRKKGDY